ncbi:MAG: PPOX class F420-dependent oxidoreductase [Micromonosporaceae bacterium]
MSASPASERMGQGFEGPEFDGKYLRINSYKRDGTAVGTPVWFVREDGRLLVQTDAQSYKVKRIRRNPSVTVALCNARGRPHGDAVAAHAELLPESENLRVERLLQHKYRVDMVLLKPIRVIQSALHLGPAHGKPVILAISPPRKPLA